MVVRLLRPPPAQRRRGVGAELIADQAVLALLHELAAWPKPGLVSYVDSGSHTDMNAAMLQAGAEALRPFFAELARAGQDGADMARLRTIGRRAEAAMLAVTGGANTQRAPSSASACSAPPRAQSPKYRPAARWSRRSVSAMSSCGEELRISGEVRIPLFSHGAAAPRRLGAMAPPAPRAKRPVDFAASTRWVGQPCEKAAHCSPTIPAHHRCRHALR
jgi:triphosphoribosyl-dephospho-CoA synthase